MTLIEAGETAVSKDTLMARVWPDRVVEASILLLGRALLGVAESRIITEGVSWGLVLAGPANAGKVIAWIGMAMVAALAVGAPLGTTLYGFGGFISIAGATLFIPLATLLLVRRSRRIRESAPNF